MRFWLRAVCAALATSSAALAEPLQLPPDIEAFYSLAAHDEVRGESRDGCGWLFPSRSIDVAVKEWSSWTWDGECQDGLAIGPGKLRDYYEGEVKSIATIWALRGRRVGEAEVLMLPTKIRDATRFSQFTWQGTTYSRNVDTVSPMEPYNDPRLYEPVVEYISPDPSKSVYLRLEGVGNRAPNQVFEVSDTDLYRRTGDLGHRWQPHPCPNGCGALWVEKAGPIIRGFDQLRARHHAEAEALKASLEPVIKLLRAEPPRAGVVQVRAEARAADEVVRRQAAASAATEATQKGRLVSTPAMEKLLERLRAEGVGMGKAGASK